MYSFKHSCVFFFPVVEDSSLLGVFHGASTGKWYIVSAALLGLVLILLVSIVCLYAAREGLKKG